MTALRHSPFDQALVDRAASLGAAVPMFTRDDDPARWRTWELCASVMIAGAYARDDFTKARAACDRVSGARRSARLHRTPCDREAFATLTNGAASC